MDVDGLYAWNIQPVTIPSTQHSSMSLQGCIPSFQSKFKVY